NGVRVTGRARSPRRASGARGRESGPGGGSEADGQQHGLIGVRGGRGPRRGERLGEVGEQGGRIVADGGGGGRGGGPEQVERGVARPAGAAQQRVTVEEYRFSLRDVHLGARGLPA